MVTRAAKSKRIELESIILANCYARSSTRSPATRTTSTARSAPRSRYVVVFFFVCYLELTTIASLLQQSTGRVPPHSPHARPAGSTASSPQRNAQRL